LSRRRRPGLVENPPAISEPHQLDLLDADADGGEIDRRLDVGEDQAEALVVSQRQQFADDVRGYIRQVITPF